MPGLDLPDLPTLTEIFESARRLGFLGPRAVADQIDHAVAFAGLLDSLGIGPADFLDLGSGGGVPGIVLAALWPDHRVTLLDSSQRRTAFLRRTIVTLGWASRVSVAEGRAETLARDPGLRATFPLVVARSFATPSVTAEVGGAFLEPGGRLAVSEPDEPGRSSERWPAAGLADLGLSPAETVRGTGVTVAVIRRAVPVGDRWPRAVAIPTKHRLW